MKTKALMGIFLALCLTLNASLIPLSVADTLQRTDFEGESFSKIVDYFQYARALATVYGLPQIPSYWYANVYMTYVNKSGVQILYAGLSNLSLANLIYFTIPMQTLLMRYKTQNNSRDVIVGSSFLMLMGFNDTARSIYQNSPDRNDTLWSSFSFGINLNALNVTDYPSLSSKSEIFPLTRSDDGLTWKWGMRYTNLTALWITTFIAGTNQTDTSKPWGLATYNELTFNYTLTIDPAAKTATIRQDHAIGRIRDIWIFWGWFIVPLYNHYNSTGTYRFGKNVGSETVYQFLTRNKVKMSIVDYQTSIMLDRETRSTSTNGQNVTDNEVFVTDSSISTASDDGEKISKADFGVKKTYKLFNYTQDPTETTSQTYDAVARTTQISGYAKNDNLFVAQKNFAKYIPLMLVHMYPSLYAKAKETITNMTRANYLYLVSYPTYGGYRIEHDPTYTYYIAPLEAAPDARSWLPAIGLVAVIIAIVLIASIVIRRRKQPPTVTESQLSQQ